MNILENTFGANYKTSLSSAATALMAGLSFVASISYDQGPIALVIPVKYKPTITTIAGIAALILWVYNGYLQKSKDVTGGNTRQDGTGTVIAKSTEDISNLPERFEIDRGDGLITKKETKYATPQELAELARVVGVVKIENN